MSPFVYPQKMPADLVVERHITINSAAAVTGYNPQYLRRLLRQGRLKGIKVGQQWLIDLDALEAYLAWVICSDDLRRGPQGLAVGEGV
jgi:excisionase family DNA binding protein